MREKYQLRHAAGSYWLLVMEQTGKDYIQPVSLNEAGAEIWRRLQEKDTVEQIAEEYHRRFQIPVTEAMADIEQFLGQLKKQGIEVMSE